MKQYKCILLEVFKKKRKKKKLCFLQASVKKLNFHTISNQNNENCRHRRYIQQILKELELFYGYQHLNSRVLISNKKNSKQMQYDR